MEWLSRWLLIAHWRCTEAFDLRFSPPPSFPSQFLSLWLSNLSLAFKPLPRTRLSTLSILVSVPRTSFFSRSFDSSLRLSSYIVSRGGSPVLLSFGRATNTVYRVSTKEGYRAAAWVWVRGSGFKEVHFLRLFSPKCVTWN